eukprot:7620248-Ditylum_brightwellii.AAC.1
MSCKTKEANDTQTNSSPSSSSLSHDDCADLEYEYGNDKHETIRILRQRCVALQSLLDIVDSDVEIGDEEIVDNAQTCADKKYTAAQDMVDKQQQLGRKSDRHLARLFRDECFRATLHKNEACERARISEQEALSSKKK